MQFFKSKLNSHGLLQKHEDAEFCLRTARALNALKEGSVDPADLSGYEIVSLHKIL